MRTDEIQRLTAPWEAEGAAVSCAMMVKGYCRLTFNDTYVLCVVAESACAARACPLYDRL